MRFGGGFAATCQPSRRERRRGQEEREKAMVDPVGTEWMPPSATSLRTVASVDPKPDSVEDVLNVCPRQALSFGKSEIRLQGVGESCGDCGTIDTTAAAESC